MDVCGGVFVFGLVVAGRVAERHGCQRNDVFRKRKAFANAVDALHVGVHAGPHGAEAEGVSGEKEIFSGGGNVLNPETAVDSFAVAHFRHVGAGNYGYRRIVEA